MSLLNEVRTETRPEHRIDMWTGTLAICEILPHKVIFMALRINLDTYTSIFTQDELESCIKERFDGECESLNDEPCFLGGGVEYNVIFSRPLDEPLRDPRSFLISTQRKLLEIFDEAEKETSNQRLQDDSDFESESWFSLFGKL